MTSRAARLLRGGVLGGVATVLAAVSHLAAGGPAPSALALALGLIFATAVGTAAVGRASAGRPLSLPRTIVGVGVAQLAFHLGFSLLGDGATVTASGTHHHAMFAITADASSAVAQGGAAMWAAHLLAGVATVLYLRRAERYVWGLLARVGGFASRVLDVLIPMAGAAPLRIPAAGHAASIALPLLRDAIARRGPPAASCA